MIEHWERQVSFLFLYLNMCNCPLLMYFKPNVLCETKKHENNRVHKISKITIDERDNIIRQSFY